MLLVQKALLRLYREFDDDGNGVLDFNEFTALVKAVCKVIIDDPRLRVDQWWWYDSLLWRVSFLMRPWHAACCTEGA